MAQILDKAQSGGGSFGDYDDDLAVGGTASDIVTQAGGDVKFLEINGAGLKVALENYVAVLSDKARATGAMSRIIPDVKGLGAMSSVAMKMLNQGQISLADILRMTIGETAGFAVIRLAMRLFVAVDVALPSLKKAVKPNPDAIIEASWPEYFELRGPDKLAEVQAETAALEGGLISQETAVDNAAGLFDVTEPTDELEKIQKEQETQRQTELDTVDQTAQITAKYNPKPTKPPTKK
jgi:hypothetical protein